MSKKSIRNLALTKGKTNPTREARADRACAPSPEGGKGGKGGQAPRPISLSNRDFIATIFKSTSPGASAIVTAKVGDPAGGSWRAHLAADVDTVCGSHKNNYFNCSSVLLRKGQAPRAKKDDADAFYALVLDDVGTKAALPLEGPEPTWVLETSPGNFQIGYALSEPETCPQLVEDAQKACAEAGLCDSGALGMTRWARLPGGVNGKPKHRSSEGDPFQCRLTAWNPDNAYRLDELIADLVGHRAVEATGLRQTPTKSSQLANQKQLSNEIFQPALAENPVVAALKAAGLYKADAGGGRHEITCPWVAEHTDQIDDGCCFFEPSASYPCGGFKCHHSHGERNHLNQLLEHLGLERSAVRNKPRIRVVEGELGAMVDAALQLLANTGEYFRAGGTIVKVSTDPITSAASLKPQNDTDLVLALARLCDWERSDTRGNKVGWRRCNPPGNCVRIMAQAQDLTNLPPIAGIARQPFLTSSGNFVRSAGYHEESHVYGAFDPEDYPLQEPSEANARAALGRLRSQLREFPFASERDEAAAVSAVFTAVLRPGIDHAPAIHVRAPSSGTGKSYLCDLISRFAGPGSPSKVSYPRTEEEATKVILAALLHGPAVLDFDDMSTDWKPYGAVNRLLTSTSMTDRVLGASRMATVSTCVLVLGSGNNTEPVGDLTRRVLVIDLDAKAESPATLSYEGNPLREIERNRASFVSDVLLVVEAWIAAGRPNAGLPSLATYGGDWTDYCREPLVWLGMVDPAVGLIERLKDDPDLSPLRALLAAWHAQFEDRALTLRELLLEADTPLQQALEELPVRQDPAINRSSLGWYLKRNANRPVAGVRLEKADRSERNAWRVRPIN